MRNIQLQFREGIAGYLGANGQDGALGGVLDSGADEPQRRLFLTKYATHKGPISRCGRTSSETPELKDRVPDLQFTLQLATLTANHVPLVDTLRRMREQGRVLHVSRSRATWSRRMEGDRHSAPTFRRISGSRRRSGRQSGGQGEGLRGDAGARHRGRAADRGARSPDPQGRAAFRRVRALFGNIADRDTGFDMARMSVRDFVASHPDLLNGVSNPEVRDRSGGAGSAPVQSDAVVHRDKPLLDADSTSMTIAQMNQGTFVNNFKTVLGGEARAAHLHDKASYTAAAAINLVANYSPAFNSLELRVLQAPGSDGVPKLERLFGSLDLCRCAHCRSVYGPAAYFAEILAFLAERPQSLTLSDGTTAEGSAKDVLFARRPDLGDIELTCENTNTPLPYVDLVNEILEMVISPFVPFALDDSLEATLNSRERLDRRCGTPSRRRVTRSRPTP